MRLVRRGTPPANRWGRLLFDAAAEVGVDAEAQALGKSAGAAGFTALPTGLDDIIMKAVVNVESHAARVRSARAQFSAVRERAVASASSLTPPEPVAAQAVAVVRTFPAGASGPGGGHPVRG